MSGNGSVPLFEDVPVTPATFGKLAARVEHSIALQERGAAETLTAISAVATSVDVLDDKVARVEEKIDDILPSLLAHLNARNVADAKRASSAEEVLLEAARAHLAVKQAAAEAGIEISKSEAKTKADEEKAARRARWRLAGQLVGPVMALLSLILTGMLAARGLLAPTTPAPPTITIEKGPTTP